jgi:hypothetical protein
VKLRFDPESGLFDAILDVTQESDGLLPVHNTIVVA